MRFRARLLAIILISSLLSLSATPALSSGRDRGLTVMTYNMYLGAELGDIFAAQTPQDVFLEVGEAYNDMLAGNVPERVAAIADQIADSQPTLVGLQEAAVWRVGAPFDPQPATTVTYDFLRMLLDELDARNAHYAPIAILTNLDAELPGIVGPSQVLDIRYTDRVVILARTDLPLSEFKLDETDARHFATVLQVPLLGQTINVLRGWTSADVKFRGKQYRFINAHLESFAEPVQNAQASEIIGGPANTSSALFVVGDFNSDAASGGSSYQLMRSAGLDDVWSALNPPNTGFTWPLAGEIPSDQMIPTQRLDLIMTRGPVSFSSISVVGEEADDRTPSGFSPSDHAGVVATVVIEP